MRFERHGVSLRQNGWQCSTIYSDDLKTWFTGKGEPVAEGDVREDSTAADFLLAVILVGIPSLIVWMMRG